MGSSLPLIGDHLLESQASKSVSPVISFFKGLIQSLFRKKPQQAQEHSFIKDFTSGGQLIMHAIRMFGQALRSMLMFGLMMFGLLVLLLFFFKTQSFDRYLLWSAGCAYFKGMAFGPRTTYRVQDEDKQWVDVLALSLIHHPRTQLSLERCGQALKDASFHAPYASVVPFLILGACFCLRGRRGRTPTDFTGQVRVKPEDLCKRLLKAHKASSFKIAGVPLLKGAEVQHLLLTGTTGTGKTLCLEELMDQIRAQKQRAIVYDIEGSFMSHYYREDKDILLNPLDARCPPWNIWQEGDKAADFEAIAASLMPLHLAGTDPFWIHSARTIFSCAAQRLQVENKQTMRDLLIPLFSEHLGSLSSLVEGSVAASLVSDKNEKTALSIKATLSTYCKALMYLNDEGSPLFSIRDWLKAEDQDSWLFIATDAQKVEALKPLISVWLDVAAKSILSLPPSDTRRLWFILDELPSLHRLPSLMNTLARGRKYGGCFVAAIQDIHQIRSIYGHHEAETFMSLFNTNLCYRTKSPQTAVWMSKIMGGLEFMEKKEGYSYGAHETRDSVSVQPERRREAVVKETEFLELNDCEAFLKLPGDWPVTHLKFEPQKRPTLGPSVLEREVSELLLFDRRKDQQATVDGNPQKDSEKPEGVQTQEGTQTQEDPQRVQNQPSTSEGMPMKKPWIHGVKADVTEVQYSEEG